MATAAGVVQSQGDKVMNADLARTVNHVDGAGFTVGVLSDSFNTSGNGSYAQDVANRDLPPNVNVLEDDPRRYR